MKVPFVDLTAGIKPIREQVLARIAQIIDRGAFVGGPAVDEFERAFAAACGAADAVAVSTGTEALVLALRALGVGPGHEVITAPNSFFATAEAISLVGATPVFADVRDDTLCIDPVQVAARITERTRAVIPVHLFGQMADLEAIEAVCAEHNLVLIEDACQAHGAVRSGRRAGSVGAMAAFSFYPAKNLGAFGEGGAITTSSAEHAEALRMLRDHGQRRKHEHAAVGTNGRLSALQCAALSVRLEHLDEYNAARRRLAARYRSALAGAAGVRLIDEDPAGVPVYHLLVVRVADRDRVIRELGEAGIATGIHYPVPIHLQPAYASLGLGPGSFPVAEGAAGEILSLPMYPELSDEAVDHVVDRLRAAIR